MYRRVVVMVLAEVAVVAVVLVQLVVQPGQYVGGGLLSHWDGIGGWCNARVCRQAQL